MPGDHFDYNQAGAESTKEQILLNLVRLKRGQSLYFVELASMLSQYSLDVEAGWTLNTNNLHGIYGPALRAAYPVKGDDVIDPRRKTDLDVKLQYSDTPTITYHPLSGEEFAERVLTPITLRTITYLARGGWSLDRLLACCVQRINDVSNAMTYCDDEPGDSRVGEDFRRLSRLMKRAHDARAIRLGEEVERGRSTAVCYMDDSNAAAQEELTELRRKLGYPERGVLRLVLKADPGMRKPDEMVIETRSILAIMQALAHEGVEPIEAGALADGFDPAIDAGGWLHVGQRSIPQSDPFVQVKLDGTWYYIEKSDWKSKRTFSLLSYLFSLQAAPSSGQAAPLVSIPAK